MLAAARPGIRQNASKPSFLDDFNRADSATLAGGPLTWVSYRTGVWGVSSNQGYLSTTAGTGVISAVECSASDGTVGVRLSVLPSTGAVGLVFRLQDANNFFLFIKVSGSMTLFRVVANSFATVQTVGGVGNAGEIASVVLSGDQIILQTAGVQRGSTVTDSTFVTATKHGIYGEVDVSARLDDWSFYP